MKIFSSNLTKLPLYVPQPNLARPPPPSLQSLPSPFSLPSIRHSNPSSRTTPSRVSIWVDGGLEELDLGERVERGLDLTGEVAKGMDVAQFGL